MKKAELKKLSQDTFFDNNQGLISPDGHRKYNEAIIDAMGMDDDVRQLKNPTIPKHAQPIVVDEVLRDSNGFASWCRSHNHVIYIPERYTAIFPIGETMHHYRLEKGKIVKVTQKIGPAVKSDNGTHYFVVTQAGNYALKVKTIRGTTAEKSFSVTEAQAATGFRIDYDDLAQGVNPGSGKDARTYARLYHTTNNIYKQSNYHISVGGTFKYSTETEKFSDATAGGADAGIALFAIKAHCPVTTRQGRILPSQSFVRPACKVRTTFAAKMNQPINMGLFLEPNISYDGWEYEIWMKKSKTWHHFINAKRYTHRFVGYVKVQETTPDELRFRSLNTNDGTPQFVDFQIRHKSPEKTVVAQYRATFVSQLDHSGQSIDYGMVFRKR